MTAALASEQAIVQKILDHIDRKTTDLADGIWREPVENYLSQARFEAEITKVFRRTPTPFCPSAALPEAGSYLARDAALTPLIAIRGSDSVVRAFRNACRHRGMQVARGTGCTLAFTCSHHGWTYDLEGRLRPSRTRRDSRASTRTRHPLVPVTAVERLGGVREAGRASARR